MANRSRSLINSLRTTRATIYATANKATTQRLLLLNDKIINNQRQQQTITTSSLNRLFHTSIRFNNDATTTITIESPAYAESIKEGDINFEVKAGDSVQADQVIARIETDKTAIEVFAPKGGVISELLVEDGATIGPNTPIIKIKEGTGESSSSSPKSSTPKKEEESTPPPPPPPSTPPPQDLPNIPQTPSAPITKTPIANIPIKQAPPSASKSSTGSGGHDITKIQGSRAETRVKMSKMRQTVARRLKESQETTCMLTTFNEINMSNLMELRKTYGEQFLKKHDLKLGFMSAFVKAASNALQDQPVVNAVIEDKEVVYRDFVDVSVAVATPKGLVVPVVRNVERMNYADIEKEIASLGERARNNKLAIEDMQGGTFTISNGGVFGSMFGTPIINLPQSSILGMHGVFERPVAEKGQVVIRPMMYIALTYDHRLIDGREAVLFLRKIKQGVEDPRSLLLDI